MNALAGTDLQVLVLIVSTLIFAGFSAIRLSSCPSPHFARTPQALLFLQCHF
ncbi:hypothetical protein K503DRAFT_770847 [Rhizopogon vinicolor AM-OR11-026]|uniref:Uncharacterized protein n=1 Tax=Rhizopogon vinicolor AM-OR11-026 TaxID=1314800 RepID=A0A1B7MZP8_9AGAM|nr:hypothetical protein K503DRAFT_770847 [Rhizopogon vinicolor AM-OR11-026]